MPTYLWRVTANRNNGKVTKGMSVEILKKDTTAKPNQKEIANALTQKYGETFNDSYCGTGNFDCIDIK